MVCLFNLEMIRPPFESTQEGSIEWFVNAHTQAEKTRGKTQEELDAFRQEIGEKLQHVGCKPKHIAKRGHILDDFLHQDWQQMKVYRLEDSPSGMHLDVRMQYYQEYADKVFTQFYENVDEAPCDLIHVSCTGYVSPSAAQKLVSKKQWHATTVVTHAYHMGCYGAIPAMRMARGFLAASSSKNQVDIVHTEICCLHSNPSFHQLDQLVSQSLFADGFIKYSMARESLLPHLKVIAIHEEMIPNSLPFMTWDVVDWGFQMSLAKEVVVLIKRALKDYLKRLSEHSIWQMEDLLQQAIFAVHPGGPKILSQVQEVLGLSDNQMRHSKELLYNYGNMSSATVPHIWKSILEDKAIPSGTPIVSLAFGPGLGIAGSIVEKVCGS
ncbi:MAG: naringenin-chalcone synthase [Chlamydiales bacterium]|nr:naringenin-chalcone synthase [Chlamydiales bacterium]